MSPIIILETSEYFVINKPPGMAVEPPSLRPTLIDWLIESGRIKASSWQPEQRCGVVHRLDTDTSGVLIWSKTPESQQRLKSLWQGRAVKKTYVALLLGECPEQDTIELPIMRDNRNDRQTVALLNDDRARPAITDYRRLGVGESSGQKVSVVEAHPITGRTHQLRVHFKAIGHPIIGDDLYGDKNTRNVAISLGVERQLLHARELCIPGDGCYSAPIPEDFLGVTQKLGVVIG